MQDPAIGRVVSASAFLAIASVVILQRAAQRARRHAQQSLKAKIKRAQAQLAPSPQANDAAQAEKLLEEIGELKRGAFVGFWENPTLSAILLPSGGTAMIQLFILLSSS